MKRRVTAHADSVEGIRNALSAGVDSTEDGANRGPSSVQLIKAKSAIWIPTATHRDLPITKDPGVSKYLPEVVDGGHDNLAIAHGLGVRIADGFYPASPAQGKNAEEFGGDEPPRTTLLGAHWGGHGKRRAS